MRAQMASWLGTAVAAVFLFTSSTALAQKPVSVGETVSATFTVEAIDHATRIVTLKAEDGTLDDILCGPDVQRFDALKVGDKVTFRYHESLATMISRPGAAPKAASATAINRSAGVLPGGTVAQQQTAVVTINAIDAKVPSVTVTAENGRKMSFKIADAKNLEGYKVGDKVEVTYTQALAVSVASAK